MDESLSMAFLLVLERLTPVERAVFLLRDVFEYEYPELATTLGQSEANCRQILHRARQHVAAMRPRFKASPQESSDLLKRFLQATRSGDLEGLVGLLAGDVVLHSDGGGKAVSAPNLIRGAKNVARGALGILEKLMPKNLVNPPGPGQWGSWDGQLSAGETVLRSHRGGRRRAHPENLCRHQPGEAGTFT